MSAAAPSLASATRELWPLLFIDDMTRSLAFYVDKLGFELVRDAKGSDGKTFWCRVQRGGVSLMLQTACDEDGPAHLRGKGVGFYFICDDTDAVHAELAARGLKLDPPTNAVYGMRQLYFNDPDGYSLCFENEIKSN